MFAICRNLKMKETSIIPGLLFLLLACLGHARHVAYDDDDTYLEPIVSQSRRTRICTELCMSGLGGTPCGSSCFDLIPTNMPLAGQNASGSSGGGSNVKYNASARKDSCDVLCKNKLGYPLCSCNYEGSTLYEPNFMEVCSAFCVNYNYQISGCQKCNLYQQLIINNNSSTEEFDKAGSDVAQRPTVRWNYWCKDVCAEGNGGMACHCDLLP